MPRLPDKHMECRSDRCSSHSRIFSQSLRLDQSVSSTFLLGRPASRLGFSSGFASSSGSALMLETSGPMTAARSSSCVRALAATSHLCSAWTSLVRKSSDQPLATTNSSMCVKVSLSPRGSPCTESWKVRTTAFWMFWTLSFATLA